MFVSPYRLGESACQSVLEAQKMAVDAQKISFGRPPDGIEIRLIQCKFMIVKYLYFSS